MQIDREPVGITRFGHQCGSTLVIRLAIGVHLFRPAVHEGRQRCSGRLGLAAHHDLLDRIAVDHQSHGFADFRLLERVVVHIGRTQLVRGHVVGEEDVPVFRPGGDLDAVGLLKPRDILHRHVLHDVHLARQQGSDAGRGFGDRGIDDLGHGGGFVPVTVKTGHHGADFGIARHQRVGAGAVRVADGKVFLTGCKVLRHHDVIRLGPALVHDERVGQVLHIERRRTGHLHVHGIVIDHRHAFHCGMQRLEARAFGTDAIQRKDHILGGEIRAVMELDAFAQLEHPDGRVFFADAPFGRQTRLQRAISGATDQRFIDVVQQGRGRPLVLRMRVQRQRIGDARPAQGLGAGSRHGQRHRGTGHQHGATRPRDGGGRELGKHGSTPVMCRVGQHRQPPVLFAIF